MVNGMHTNRLEVINMPFAYDTDSSVPIDVTSLERTLLDITVRPVYAGGVEEVLKAFIRAKGRADIQSLVEILRKLDYVYPYHQAVGYYLERAGYCPEEIELVSAIPMEHDFYLTHYTGETVYVKHWRLHVPVTFPGL
jgi:predicted transcriptional regulator of viral defense system